MWFRQLSRSITRRLTYANVMATLAVLLACAGTSVAAVSMKASSVRSLHIAPNAVTSAKVKNGTLQRSDFARGVLGGVSAKGAPGATGPQGATGPAGATGPQGPAGPRGQQGIEGPRGEAGPQGEPGIDGVDGQDGANATKLWAVVRLDGTLARGSQATGSARTAAGTFVVTFDRNVSSCSYLATIGGDNGGIPTAGLVSATNRATDVNAIVVKTRNVAGQDYDHPFHVAVFC